MQALRYAFNPINVYSELCSVFRTSAWGRWYIPLCSVLIVYLSLSWGSAGWEILSAVSGVFCVVLVAERKITNFFWGLINCSLYGLTSYYNSFYGDMSLNWFLYVPFQFLGLWSWYQASSTEDVPARVLKVNQLLSLVVGVIGSTALVGTTLSLLNGAHPYVDASNVVLSILATILMWQRFSEQWLCWILVNVTGIAMWTLNLLHGQGEGLPALLMWVAFLVNSVYGYYTWRRNALTRVYDAIA